jgi:hypothetical protein
VARRAARMSQLDALKRPPSPAAREVHPGGKKTPGRVLAELGHSPELNRPLTTDAEEKRR